MDKNKIYQMKGRYMVKETDNGILNDNYKNDFSTSTKRDSKLGNIL